LRLPNARKGLYAETQGFCKTCIRLSASWILGPAEKVNDQSPTQRQENTIKKAKPSPQTRGLITS
jgi:hypothetical protein